MNWTPTTQPIAAKQSKVDDVNAYNKRNIDGNGDYVNHDDDDNSDDDDNNDDDDSNDDDVAESSPSRTSQGTEENV